MIAAACLLFVALAAVAGGRYRKGSAVEVFITRHAAERAKAMGVGTTEIIGVLAAPDVDYCQPRYGPTRRMAQRGRLGVAYAERGDRKTVVTVVWNQESEWVRPAVAGA